MSKLQRLITIKELINTKKIASQEELMNELNILDIQITQATLSRDLKQIKAYKIADHSRGYIYAINEIKKDVSDKIAHDFASKGLISIEFANNLGVLKTIPGYAGSIASTIDKENLSEIIGTIAGDDTILIIPAENVQRKNIIQSLRLIFPDLTVKSR